MPQIGWSELLVIAIIAIVVALVVLLFGRGKVSELMGDVAKGIKSFKKNISSVEDSDNKNLSDKNNKNSES